MKKGHIFIPFLLLVMCGCTDGIPDDAIIVTDVPSVTVAVDQERATAFPSETSPTKSVITTTPEIVGTEDKETPTQIDKATPDVMPTPTPEVPEKQLLSDRIVVKTEKTNIGEEKTFFYQVRHDKKTGLINQFGEVVVEPIYDNIYPFSEGLARVRLEGKEGFLNESGELVIPLMFRFADDFGDGLASVCKGSLYGYIDTTGQYVIEPKYEQAYSFSEGLAPVQEEYGLGTVTYIRKDGEIAFEIDCGVYGDFHEGRARMQALFWEEGTYGFVDETGYFVIEPFAAGSPEGPNVIGFSDGYAIMDYGVENDTLTYVYVDVNGEILGDYVFTNVEAFSEGLAYAERDGICGYIDTTGEYVITGIGRGEFHDGLAEVPIDGKVGFIDKTGTVVIEAVYSRCEKDFENGYAVVRLGEERICINKSGEEMWRLLPEE